MNKSQSLIQGAIYYFGEAKKSFKLKKAVKGISFDSNKTVMIPVGNYVVVEDDERDDNRYIIANKADQELYAIEKKLAQ